ncbi:hypothetical protein C8R45DRAFT_936050 [Mycena sanguinolenta]|nr:hypothetical protein C8R45DRAFT_936050 [Mycena sanguinolenta]
MPQRTYIRNFSDAESPFHVSTSRRLDAEPCSEGAKIAQYGEGCIKEVKRIYEFVDKSSTVPIVVFFIERSVDRQPVALKRGHVHARAAFPTQPHVKSRTDASTSCTLLSPIGCVEFTTKQTVDTNSSYQHADSSTDLPHYLEISANTSGLADGSSTLPPPSYVPLHNSNPRNISFFSTPLPPRLPHRGSFSAGDSSSIISIRDSTSSYDISGHPQRQMQAVGAAPPQYTPTDPFLNSVPSQNGGYNSFWSTIRPAPVAAKNPTNYAEFFSKKSISNAGTLLPTSTTIPCTTTAIESLPTPTRLSEPFQRSFGTDSTNMPSSSPDNSSMDVAFDFMPSISQIKRKQVSEADSPSKENAKRHKLDSQTKTSDKLDKVFDVWQDLEWTIGDFMHYLCAHRDTHRSKRHVMIVRRYLSGKGSHHVGQILECWLTSPDDAGYDLEDQMYDTHIPYCDIAHVRAALTSFAAQVVKTKLINDTRHAANVSGRLHVPTEQQLEPDDNGKFTDLGTSLRNNMKDVIQLNQRLLFDFAVSLASPEPIRRNGVISERRNRPPELTAISTISMITFSGNHYAWLYPLVRGIIYMASHVPSDVISLNSHLGTMLSINTIKSALKGFSKRKAIHIRSMGRDTAVVEVNGRQVVKANVIIFDNSQHFRRQHKRRIGRENTMILVNATALDPLDKQQQISFGLRQRMTVEIILSPIDFAHLRRIRILQFIEALVTYIPEAAVCKDAMLDFLGQRGQTADSYDNRLWFGRGDGMSYNNMLLIQKYMRNHTESPFQSFQLMHPVLQVWHTMWTDLCWIHETHWGAPLNDNPASLGNSAKKIGRPAPSNLKKVDYYPAADLLVLIHVTNDKGYRSRGTKVYLAGKMGVSVSNGS